MTKPGYKMTEIGELPEEWEVVEIGDNKVSELVMGQSPPSSSYNASGNGIPFLQGNADFGEIIPSPSIYCTKPLKLAEKGDILLSVRAPVGELNIAAFKCVIGRGLAAIRCNDKKTHYKYLYYYLKYSVNRLRSLSTGSTFKAVGKEILSHFEICLPDFEEQKKIAEILSTADETIQKVNEEITLTEKLKKGLMQTLLTKGIGHTKFKMTEIGEIPDAWDVKELYQVSELRKETIEPKKYMSEHFVGLENISPGQLRIFSYGDATNLKSSKFKFKKGDILYGKLRPYLDKVALAETDGVCSTDIIPIVSKNSNARFLAYMLHSDLFLQFVKSTISGTNHPRTAWKQMSHFLIPFPSISEQQKVAEILSTVDHKLELFRNKKAHFEELKKGMMGDLLTGRVRVKIATSKGEN